MRSLPLAAFVAGLVSFLSSCVLPPVPGCVSLISGNAVFLASGAAAASVGRLVRQHTGLLSKAAGTVIIVLGLHQTGALPIRLFYTDKRFHAMPKGTAGARAFLVGTAFGFGWTQCVGSILVVILTFAVFVILTTAPPIRLLALRKVRTKIPALLYLYMMPGAPETNRGPPRS